MRRLLTACLLLWGIVGCGGPEPPWGKTPQAGLEAFIGEAVTVFQEVPAGEQVILLHKQARHPAPTAVLMARDRWGRWSVEGGWASGPLRNMGPVSFAQHYLGRVEEKIGPTTFSTGRYQATYGVVNDPDITWVEVTLTSEEGMVMRAPVVNGTWVAWFRMRSGPPYPKFSIRGGDAGGERFFIPNGWGAVTAQQ